MIMSGLCLLLVLCCLRDVGVIMLVVRVCCCVSLLLCFCLLLCLFLFYVF